MHEWKKTGNSDKSAMLEAVQHWYMRDKGVSVQEELIALLAK